MPFRVSKRIVIPNIFLIIFATSHRAQSYNDILEHNMISGGSRGCMFIMELNLLCEFIV